MILLIRLPSVIVINRRSFRGPILPAATSISEAGQSSHPWRFLIGRIFAIRVFRALHVVREDQSADRLEVIRYPKSGLRIATSSKYRRVSSFRSSGARESLQFGRTARNVARARAVQRANISSRTIARIIRLREQTRMIAVFVPPASSAIDRLGRVLEITRFQRQSLSSLRFADTSLENCRLAIDVYLLLRS